MDLEELKAQHPAVYKAAQAEGSQREHERIVGHLSFGEATGALRTALAAIENGSEMTPQIAGIYMSAARNRADVRARQSECDEVESAIENMPPPSSYGDAFGEAVFERLKDLVGAGEA